MCQPGQARARGWRGWESRTEMGRGAVWTEGGLCHVCAVLYSRALHVCRADIESFQRCVGDSALLSSEGNPVHTACLKSERSSFSAAASAILLRENF